MPEELNPGQSAVRRLVMECKDSITGKRQIAGYHCGPYMPILFLMFGSACEEQKIQQVKETTELAWNSIQGNLKILQYPHPVQKEQLIKNMEAAITQLKSLPDGIFRVYNNTRIYFFLEGEDEEFNEYIRMLDENLTDSFEMVQVLVVLQTDESTLEKKKRARRQISAVSELKRERKIQGALILSNVLQNGRILNSEEKNMQYRIAADIAFLSNSYELSTGMEHEISREIADTLMRENQMCTAAYIKRNKPSEKIARATLRAMIRFHEERERAVLESDGFDNSSHGFRKRLTPNQEDGVFGLEKYFREEVRKNFPRGVRLEDFPYFPEMDTIRKKGIGTSAELEGMMRSCTQGVWELFVQYNYTDQVKEFIREKREEIYGVIKNYLNREFSYEEILEYADHASVKEDILKDLKQILPAANGFPAEDPDRMLVYLAEKKARELFFAEIGDIAEKAFLDVCEMCRRFRNIVADTEALLGIGYFPDAICSFYEQRVRELYSCEKYRQDMNQICDNIQQYCEQLKAVFLRYTAEYPKIYLTSFEKELANRIEENTMGTILEDLGYKNRKLEDECRFQYGKIPEGNCYCIAFAKAAFIPNLEQQRDLMGRLFCTSRQESVERIMLCPFECESDLPEGGTES